MSGPQSIARARGGGVLLLVALVAIAAIAWGAWAGSRPVGQRPPVRVTPVDAAWYAALPIVRAHEAEADLFGLNASQQPIGLADFMLRDADARPLSPGVLVEWALYSHPAPANRIATAMRWRAEHLPR